MLQETRFIHFTKKRVAVLCHSLKFFTGEKSITQPTFLSSFNNTCDDHGVCNGVADRVIAYMQSNRSQEL